MNNAFSPLYERGETAKPRGVQNEAGNKKGLTFYFKKGQSSKK
jgi:hypothetical protein